jgi:hypothetical protein
MARPERPAGFGHGTVIDNFSEDVARTAVWQFLRSKDPRIRMLRKFAAAAGISITDLLAEPERQQKKSAST